jgi:adenosylcobinamide-GDP ribazoletransferase
VSSWPFVGVAGAIGFLSRVPVGRTERAWDAFRKRPATMVAAGYPIGAVLALPMLLVGVLPDVVRVPNTTIAFVFLVWVYLVTGITHLDGVTDLGDAAAVHGDVDRRRAVLKDSAIGAGGALALGAVLVGLTTAGIGLANAPVAAATMVISVEVAAKTGMATTVCLSEPRHEGLGAALLESSGPAALIAVVAVATPAALLTWPRGGPPLVGGGLVLVAAFTAKYWAGRALGGVNGDVLGAINELVRIVGLHVGVILWRLS